LDNVERAPVFLEQQLGRSWQPVRSTYDSSGIRRP
jgi:hypothetical protein